MEPLARRHRVRRRWRSRMVGDVPRETLHSLGVPVRHELTGDAESKEIGVPGTGQFGTGHRVYFCDPPQRRKGPQFVEENERFCRIKLAGSPNRGELLLVLAKAVAGRRRKVPVIPLPSSHEPTLWIELLPQPPRFATARGCRARSAESATSRLASIEPGAASTRRSDALYPSRRSPARRATTKSRRARSYGARRSLSGRSPLISESTRLAHASPTSIPANMSDCAVHIRAVRNVGSSVAARWKRRTASALSPAMYNSRPST